MHFQHEARKPLVDALAHSSGAGIGARDDPDHRVRNDNLEDIPYAGLDVAAGFFWGMNQSKPQKEATPNTTFITIVPAAPMSMARLPPRRSVKSPLMI